LSEFFQNATTLLSSGIKISASVRKENKPIVIVLSDVIVLSEIWSYNVSLYSNHLSGYHFHYDLPSASSVGGVGIYVRSSHGGTENAGLEKSGPENVGPNRSRGKDGTGKRGNIMCMGSEM